MREYAKSQSVTITGTLGLIKAVKLKGIITDNKMYKEILEKLRDDLYVSDNLIQWALELSTEY